MANKEYEGWHNRVSEEINPERGIESELERKFRGEEREPTDAQKRITRRYWEDKGTETDAKAVRFESGGKDYVKTDDNTYQRVDSKEYVVFSPRTGELYIKGDDGRIKGKVE